MNALNHVVLAANLEDVGDSFLGMLENWATNGFKTALIVIVVVVMVQRFSLKAGIGALLMMAAALGLYESRESLADMFRDQVNNPVKSAPAVPGPPHDAWPASSWGER